jgi:Ser/Thr protein kinase RdoA (MazF antagonist)
LKKKTGIPMHEDHDEEHDEEHNYNQSQGPGNEQEQNQDHNQPELDPQDHPYSKLTPDMVMDAAESTGLRCDARILELNSYENRVYQIGVEDSEPVVGKFYRHDRWTDEQILEEHNFTLELADEDVSVVAPLKISGDSTLSSYAGFRFALYPRSGGRAPELDDYASLTILGRHIARIHSVGGLSTFTTRPTISIDSHGYASRTYLMENGFISPELLPAYESVTEHLLAQIGDIFAQQETRLIRLHGDCHMGNVLWRNDLPHFVDFDDARMGPPIQDLWMMLSGDKEDQQKQFTKILEGYRDFCDFDLRQIRLIEPLRSLRLMYHSAWIARRWQDPAFPRAFPFFNTERYWSDHILDLREQWSKLSEPTLEIYI